MSSRLLYRKEPLERMSQLCIEDSTSPIEDRHWYLEKVIIRALSSGPQACATQQQQLTQLQIGSPISRWSRPLSWCRPQAEVKGTGAFLAAVHTTAVRRS